MLTMKSLEVCYGETVILRNIDFRIREGEVVSLLGRNGVGKTTLLKTVIGLLRPRQGKIYLHDKEITKDKPEQRAKNGIAYVPQGREVFPQLTVEENLLLGLEALPKREKQIPHEVFEMFPMLNTMLQRKGGDLSGGQQQQLAIARALVARPKLLLLDEPTEGIQPNIVMEIENVIRLLKAQGDMAILLVEQSLDFALSLADYCYVLEKGAVAAEGKASEIEDETIRQYLTV
ncbi:urea ABC transporter ATP-binding subunit UrtE [Effusibacillus lacus]|uniref:ABC transporter ATP-binding protein n=1 Tax=Effusibacillus lacus TaxID=1348429 RepID=A0A292YLS3_9BACL|nr:urea ABC transporter ATP-binding subunit UrtE [Effusibacillus lacus]TCS71233.1 urea transport system ATP-binding protein [Effusibacillus lacus]GAX89859.1 ABC transporter ATP-binding protein [Effusibacillus lacus]